MTPVALPNMFAASRATSGPNRVSAVATMGSAPKVNAAKACCIPLDTARSSISPTLNSSVPAWVYRYWMTATPAPVKKPQMPAANGPPVTMVAHNLSRANSAIVNMVPHTMPHCRAQFLTNFWSGGGLGSSGRAFGFAGPDRGTQLSVWRQLRPPQSGTYDLSGAQLSVWRQLRPPQSGVLSGTGGWMVA